MKNAIKKIIITIICSILVFSSSTTNLIVQAEDTSLDTVTSGQCGDNTSWNFDSSTGTLTISGTGQARNENWEHLAEKVKYVVISEKVVIYGYFTSDYPNLIEGRGKCGKNATWKFNKKTATLTISGKGAMYNYAPEEEGGIVNYPWASFNTRLMWNDSNTIQKIEIKKGITSIGNYCFESLGNVKKVTIPKTVTKIGVASFAYCGNNRANMGKQLDLTIPNSVKTIGKSAFEYCAFKSKNFIIPDSVKTIGDDAFINCYFPKTITIGKNVTKIGAYNFTWNGGHPRKIYIKSEKIKSFSMAVFFNNSPQYTTTIYLPSNKYDSYKKSIKKSLNIVKKKYFRESYKVEYKRF